MKNVDEFIKQKLENTDQLNENDNQDTYDLSEKGYEFLEEITSILDQYGISGLECENFKIIFNGGIACSYEIDKNSFCGTKIEKNGRDLGIEAMSTRQINYK